MEPELIADYQNHVGEGPLWNQLDNKLYWIDIPQALIFKFDPKTKEHEIFYEGTAAIGGFTIQENGDLLLFMENGGIAKLSNGSLEYLFKEISEEKNGRFNDVIADPEGRVFCGTMPDQNGNARLYKLDTDGALTKVLDGIKLSNGLGFSPDCSKMYYTDTFAKKIYQFDYERKNGEITNQRNFVQIDGEGMPDGMTVDEQGCVWSAIARDSSIKRYADNGLEKLSITFPTELISSCTFGGAHMDELYVTTIGGDQREEYGPVAGALFRVKLNIRGVPEYLSKINM